MDAADGESDARDEAEDVLDADGDPLGVLDADDVGVTRDEREGDDVDDGEPLGE